VVESRATLPCRLSGDLAMHIVVHVRCKKKPSEGKPSFFFLARTRFLVHRELLAKNMPTFSGQCDYDRHMT
jgi:hypothetical protein